MTWLYLSVFGSMVGGLLVAVAGWLIWGRKITLPTGSIRWFTIAAGILALLAEIATRFVGVSILLPFQMPRGLSDWYFDYRFVVPVAFGILVVALLSFPVQARGARGAAELTRRSFVSFVRPRWFIAPGVLLALVLLITIVAGAASQPGPESGNYTMYFVDLGGERGMGTSVYGWFYSLPAMILTGILIVVTIVALSLIARPALAEDSVHDVCVRTVRSRNIIAAGTGALMLHLGLIFGSLAATASVRSTFSTSEGSVTFWTTFSALQPSFDAASMLCAALGVALWATVVLSALASRHRVPVTLGS